MDGLPTSDAGHVYGALIGVTDVSCLDDTPDVMHNFGGIRLADPMWWHA
jgi:hypothetical protein